MSKGIVLLIFIIQLSLLVTLIKLTFKERVFISNELGLNPFVRWMSIRWEIMLSRMSSWATIVYIYTLMLQSTSCVKHIWSILSRLSIRMIEECFCHWNLKVVTSSNSRRANIKMSFNKLLFPVSSNRESWFILFRRWLFEIILVLSLKVGGWILWNIYITFMSNFKVVCF